MSAPRIPDDAIELKFIRASGPGGQNVNKVASAVQLRLDLTRWPELPSGPRDRLRRLAGRRITDEDVIVITAHRLRTQEQNRRDAFTRLEELIEQAMVEPKVRRATKPTRASKERRVKSKLERSSLKQNRSKVRSWD